MAFATATDIGYALIALWAPPSAKPLLRWWSRHRYFALAPTYDAYVAKCATTYGAALDAALDFLTQTPHRVLDVSTGTGYAADVVARRYPDASVVACDLSLAMAQHAQRRLRPGSVICADSATLPFADETFDLVVLQNAPPSLKELARLVALQGSLLLAFSAGAGVPVWIRSRLDHRLGGLGFGTRIWNRVGAGLFVIASRGSGEAR